MPSSTTVTTAVSPTASVPRAETSTVTVEPPVGAQATRALTWTSSALSRVAARRGTRPKARFITPRCPGREACTTLSATSTPGAQVAWTGSSVISLVAFVSVRTCE